MRKKLEGNGLWESNRMMLPEHKDRINIINRHNDKMKKPELTEKEQQELYGRLRASMSNVIQTRIKLFRENGNLEIAGIVTSIDPRYQLIKVEQGPSWEVFQFADVLQVDLDATGY
ncbi:YolD-like family protein [Paenibacillus radicis (ex Xue et al. 2023)]|uniref:YolD-like family protein n=1 Tax=Paenibacillus radicis (ex Xue et al. 2023) TaxID=2972489 RepID=A0ABT1YRB9_9BACL|nr:YolD-like family protein [Paenibacillus radicis (ex Xue et al. 2023)]MCR8635732.1 YolD-like family protein [Paenibacillus radicis (ex Xue et al. 2023)]